MLIRNAEIEGEHGWDIRCHQGIIQEIGQKLPPQKEEDILNAKGGALLPGLHDHHLHLFALSVAENSIICGPPHVKNFTELATALHPSGQKWIRGIGYHEMVAGDLTRHQLDSLNATQPIRIQHRSGKLWIVNSRAAAELGLDRCKDVQGIERDHTGRPTGRLFRLDHWIRERLGPNANPKTKPDLAATSQKLARCGVTGFTDATPTNCTETAKQLTNYLNIGDVKQRVYLMGKMDLTISAHDLLCMGPVKLFLDEDRLPDITTFIQQINYAHESGRAVAIHCVTQTELIFALTCLKEAIYYSGDRIEHASLTPEQAFPLLKETNVTIVTQHGFLHERGNSYLTDIPKAEHHQLYRGQRFLSEDIPLAGSTDAPYGDPDPWAVMRSAIKRETENGILLGPKERLNPEQALALFTTPATNPGGKPRQLKIGHVADLCLLKHPWATARKRLLAEDVAATIVGGTVIYEDKPS